MVVFMMLNPSMADNKQDDQTTEKCIEYAKRWGYGHLEIINLFSYISTDPSDLKTLSLDITVGSDNDFYIKRALQQAHCIVVAWGEKGTYQKRSKDPKLVALLNEYRDKVYCFGKCKSNNEPQHPSRLSYERSLELFVQ